ncbi:response regulator receiver protein [Methanoregula boonei 6A8]|jgi:CheY-like chemotaxis protein|uniref:Response regulator receiver protein n=1 Tax=Methanoregula boonei (strain DSM 21154 / JCM 14090 / 6A8) TaxID=456442 RepID=A7I6X2_METB6|nr:response regulator [Methanoregula boonei]ABS55483.1 response regulator receiver protein [Methanoregula boonei 6A8]
MEIKKYAGFVLLLLLVYPAAAAVDNPYQKIAVISFSFADTGVNEISSEVRYGTAPNLDIQTGTINGLLLDSQHRTIDEFSIRDPRIQIGEGDGSGGGLTGDAQYSHNGEFGIIVPFIPDLRYVTLEDTATGATLATVDLSPAIAAFQQLYPQDPDMQSAQNTAVPNQSLMIDEILLVAGIMAMAVSGIAYYIVFLYPRAERILIVDDEKEIAEVFSLLLEKKGYVTMKANSGKECLLLLKAWWKRPDIILLDIMMSPMDGWETLEKIKSDPRSKMIPVLMLTGFTPTPDQAHRYGLCIDDYILKPVNAQGLYDAIGNVLERRRLIREAVRAAMRAGYEKETVCAYARLRRRVEVDKKLLGIISTASPGAESGRDASFKDIAAVNRELQSDQETLRQLQRKLEPVLSPFFPA